MAQDEPTLKGHRLHIAKDGVERQEIIYLTTDQGSMTLLVCGECRLIEAYCNHDKNSWNEDGTKLLCDLCGIDGT